MRPHEYEWEEIVARVAARAYGTTAPTTSHIESAKKALQYAGIDRLFGKFAMLNEESTRWLVPRDHRPSCPLNGQPCTSWTCLVDVCVDVKTPLDDLEALP